MRIDSLTSVPDGEHRQSLQMTSAQLDDGASLGNLLSDVQDYFGDCDNDGDGRIHYDEFVVLLRYFGVRSADLDCNTWFQKIDADHDGFIDMYEFVAEWMENEAE